MLLVLLIKLNLHLPFWTVNTKQRVNFKTLLITNLFGLRFVAQRFSGRVNLQQDKAESKLF